MRSLEGMPMITVDPYGAILYPEATPSGSFTGRWVDCFGKASSVVHGIVVAPQEDCVQWSDLPVSLLRRVVSEAAEAAELVSMHPDAPRAAVPTVGQVDTRVKVTFKRVAAILLMAERLLGGLSIYERDFAVTMYRELVWCAAQLAEHAGVPMRLELGQDGTLATVYFDGRLGVVCGVTNPRPSAQRTARLAELYWP